tara:strand:+ start:6085 stop:10158 length:4074 start_codon:yes stop_codon:yes gene_type:complete
MSDINKFTSKEVLNKVLLDSSGNAVNAFSHTTQEALNAALDATNNRLNVALEGGTISGDVTIAGDLTVNGGGSMSYSEVLNGDMIIVNGAGTLPPLFAGHQLVLQNNDDSGDQSRLAIIAGATGYSVLDFGDNSDVDAGGIAYQHHASADLMTLRVNATDFVYIKDSGVGIGAIPTNNLHIEADSGDEGITIHSAGDTGNAITIDANRSGAGSGIGTMLGKWNGTTIGYMGFFSGADTTNKDDGVLKFATTPSGGSATVALTIGSDQSATFGGELDVNPATNKRIKFTFPTDEYANESRIGFSDLNAHITYKAQNNFMEIWSYNSLFLQTGSSPTTALTLDSSQNATFGGNVGINDTSPAHKLSIRSSAFIHLGYEGTSTSTETGRISTNSYDVENASYSLAEMSFLTESANGYTGQIQFRTNSVNSTNSRAAVRMTINSAGNVGINDATPAAKLVVVGDASIGSTTNGLYFGNTSGVGYIQGTDTEGSGYNALGFKTSANYAMYIDASENVGIGVSSSLDHKLTIKTSATGGDWVKGLQSDGGQGFRIGADSGDDAFFELGSAGTSDMVLLSADGDSHFKGGNVGIGAVPTAAKLEIHGGGYNTSLLIKGSGSHTGIKFVDSGGTTDGLIYAEGGEIGFLDDDEQWAVKVVTDTSTSLLVNNSTKLLVDANSRISLSNNDAGDYNTIFGNDVGDPVSGQDHNTFIGHNVAATGTMTNAADKNTVVGSFAFNDVTTGSNNVAIGYDSLAKLTEGSDNIAVGASAGDAVTSQSNLVLIGKSAGGVISGDNANGTIAIGFESLTALTDGASNTAVGYKALHDATTEIGNVSIGYKSGEFIRNDASDYNVLIGTESGVGGTAARNHNIAMGYRAMGSAGSQNNIGGNENIFIGSYSGNGTWATAGSDGNTAIGYDSLSGALNGALQNTAVGKEAMKGNTSGDYNVALGNEALKANEGGQYNIAIGHQSMLVHTGGLRNVAIGAFAMKDTDSGSPPKASDDCVLIGYSAGGGTWANQDCSNLIGIGTSALSGALEGDTADGAIAIGRDALTALTSGSKNTAVGYKALKDNTIGHENTAFGYQALLTNVDGDSNTAIGGESLKIYEPADGVGQNTALGFQSGDALVTGSANTLIGFRADTDDNAGVNQTVIGSTAQGQADNSVTLGNADVEAVYMASDSGAKVHCGRADLITNYAGNYPLHIQNQGSNANRYGIRIQAGADDASGTTIYINALDGNGDQVGHISNTSGTFALTDPSDKRLKKNIVDTSVKGLETVGKMKIRDFEWKKSGDKMIGGFIAQELKEAYPSAVTGTDGQMENVLDEDGKKTGEKIVPMGVSRDVIVPVLVKAIQELEARVKELESK